MEQVFLLVTEMAPYLLLGFLIAGLMHAFIPSTIYSKYLAPSNFKSVLLAALFGIPLPLCSCGVIPTAMSLRREGASKGATTSFLIATPQTGVDSIIATFSLMGLPFAILRPIAALTTALFGGQMVNFVEGTDSEGHTTAAGQVEATCDCGHCDATDHQASGSWSCNDGRQESERPTFIGRLKSALRYAFVDMMEDIGRWLVIGIFVAGLITVFVPDSIFEVFKDNSLASMLLVLCIAVPMYLCATGSIPIAVALMMKGLTPGAGLVLLMAGPACNVASILVINKVLGRRTLITYLASIIAGAVGFGLITDHLLPREWFLSALVTQDACCHTHYSTFSLFCTALLALLLLNALVHRFSHGHTHHHDSPADHQHADHQHADHSNPTETCPTTTETSGEEQIFAIGGMNCNHCRTSVERAILSVEGVAQATVDLPSATAIVQGSAAPDAIVSAVEAIGFTCAPKDTEE